MQVKSYDLSLDVDFQALSYQGNVRLSLQDSTSDITLNSVGLEILRATAGGKSVTWGKGADEEELVFHGVPIGDASLEISFTGKVADGVLVGLYKSRFDGGYMLTTQFESTQARRMFPCVDHPGYKAVFNVDITIPEDLRVVFNTESREVTQLRDFRKRVVFQPTPRMSTYLLYLGIAHFYEVERICGKLRVIVALPKEKRDSAKFALDHGAPIVEFFERYFGIPYPLPKLHLISVADAWFGAMENWGAISFRELALLVNEDTSTLVKRHVALTIAHEIAHQWFGDLVTMAWWNDLWLNESFATFMATQAVDHLHPEWKVWNTFLAEDLSSAMLWDALVTTHPIEAHIVRTVEIDEAFDEISYEKGGAVLRMIEAYLGREAFGRGVSTYLKRFQYGNATSQDLWQALEDETGAPIPKIMGAWVQRKGYPLLKVRREGPQLHLEQDRFLLDGTETSEPWPIPVAMTVNGKELRFVMEGRSHAVDVGSASLKLTINNGRTGYYRVLYEGDLKEQMIKELRNLPEADRWGVVQDTYAFLLADRVPLKEYLALVRECATDVSDLVTVELLSQIGHMIPLVEDLEPVREVFRAFARTQMERVGLENRPGEPHTTKELREKLCLLRVYLDDTFASELSKKFPTLADAAPELRWAIGAAAARTGGKAEHEGMVKAFLAAATELEEMQGAMALSSFRQPELLRDTLALITREGTGIGRAITLVTHAVNLASRTATGREVLWEWMQKNLDMIYTVTQGSAEFSRLLQMYVSTGGIGREEEMRRYLGSKPMPGGESGKAKGLELLRLHERLYRKLRES